ncbi:MAG: SDR family oxidoreductase [Rhizobacter sp.]|nr:SDR family oxidoreductase [Rhizobacter sp.]
MSAGPRVVMLTGAAGNLGRAVASAFGAVGERLVLVDLKSEALSKAFGKETPNQMFGPADLMRQADVDGVVQAALQRFGRIDVLCNLAGGFRMGEAVHETSDESWAFLLDLNARTLLRTAHAVVPVMLAQGGGRIVNVGAASAGKGLAQMGAYVASKSVVSRLTESMSAELRGQGINVNCVLPSIIDTPENRKAMPDADPARWVTPEALADVIVFLASGAARAVHGASLPVTGLS